MTWRGGDQVIPRPSGATPGGPAPWAALAPEQRRGLSINRVLSALGEHSTPATMVPDVFLEADAFLEDGVINTGYSEIAANPSLRADAGIGPAVPTRKPAAVLVAMFEESNETRVILTRRSGALRHHKGEVSFPGGRIEPGENPVDCALREAHEETGLDPSSVSVVGQLSPLLTLSSTSLITPVVGVVAARPILQAAPAEVALVFDVELAELCSDGVFREERWNLAPLGEPTPGAEPDAPGLPTAGKDGSFPVWFFELPRDTVWGATARVLVELLRAVLGV